MVKKGKHFSGKVTPLFASMLAQPTEDEGAPSERPSEAQPTPSPIHTSKVPLMPQTDPSPIHTSEVPVEPQTDPSPRPSPSTTIPDSISESSGGNLGGHSSSDKSLSGNEGELTLQSVYDLCLSLCAQVSNQANEIQRDKCMDKSKITRKQSKASKHGHENQKSTKPKPQKTKALANFHLQGPILLSSKVIYNLKERKESQGPNVQASQTPTVLTVEKEAGTIFTIHPSSSFHP
ncbi:hypothetical protein Tco_0108183, partial [Tanacetum coccineum]